MNLPQDLKNYRADPLGSFRICPQEIADWIIFLAVMAILFYGALPDLHAWIAGAAPVGGCR